MKEIVIAVVASGTLSTIINVVVMSVKDWVDRKKGLRASMRILLDDRLCWLAEKYLREGEISQSNLKIYTKMWQSYKDLGGNGYHDKLLAKLEALPTKGDKDND